MYIRGWLILTFLLCFFAKEAHSTHLVGGNMSYVYMGERSNGQVGYKVIVKMYRDCWSSGFGFASKIEIGIYHNNLNRDLYRTLSLNKITERSVANPNSLDTCWLNPTICLKEGIYEATVDVDQSLVGYHLVFERCCRNIMANIQPNQGQTFYTFIPPTATGNNSSSFTQLPVSYTCVNDSFSFANYTIDVDGDSLVFQVSTPWAGGSAIDTEPAARPTWPQIPSFDPLLFKTGFTGNNPFGNVGFINVNPQNGFTSIYASQQGVYTYTVDVLEYRNGNLLSRNHLDMAVFVVSCPDNPVPVVSTGSNTFSYEVVEGETVCFPVNASDPYGDSITLSAYGQVFSGGTGFGNVASFDPKTGAGSVSSNFCWTPSCGRASAKPYTFILESKDNGCPRKTRLQQVSILVKPYIQIPSITGDSLVCRDTTGSVYSVQGTPTSIYNWNVIGGNIVQGQNTQSIKVIWGTGPSGQVKLYESVSGVCGQNRQITRDVVLKHGAEYPNIIGKDTLCEFTSSSSYGVIPLNGYSYNWTVSGGSANGGNNLNSIDVKWGASGTGILALVQTNGEGCKSDTVKMQVHLQKPAIDTVAGNLRVCPNARSVEYSIPHANSESAYYWGVTGGNIISDNGKQKIRVDWGDTGTGIVEVYEVSKFTCVGPHRIMQVQKNHSLQVPLPSGDDSLCEKTKGVIYTVSKSTGSTYLWTINNGYIIQGNQSNQIIVDWGTAGIAELTIREIAYDSINNLACVSQPKTLPVFLGKQVAPAPVIGEGRVCQSDNDVPYYFNGMKGSTFDWWFTGNVDVSGLNDSLVMLKFTQPGIFKLSGREVSAFGCQGPVIDKSIEVKARPVTSNITGPNISSQFYDTFSVVKTPGSYYSWNISGEGELMPGINSHLVIVKWKTSVGIVSLNVTEINADGCPGDTINKSIYINNNQLGLSSRPNGPAWQIFPNPTEGVISLLQENSSAGTFTMQVINQLGAIVLSETWEQQDGKLARQADLRSLPPGIYSVMLHSGVSRYSQTVIIR